MVRAMEVVVVKGEEEASGALVGMGVGVSVGPFAEGGLDEPLGLAVGLWGVGPGEAVLEAEGGEGGAHGVCAVAGAIVGVEALGGDAVLLKESEG